MSYQKVLSTSVTLKRDGVIKVTGVAYQSFSAGNAAHGFRLYIDGGDPALDTGYHLATDDFVPLLAVKKCAAGVRVVELYWAGDPSITLNFANLAVEGFNGTSG